MYLEVYYNQHQIYFAENFTQPLIFNFPKIALNVILPAGSVKNNDLSIQALLSNAIFSSTCRYMLYLYKTYSPLERGRLQ